MNGACDSSILYLFLVKLCLEKISFLIKWIIISKFIDKNLFFVNKKIIR